AVSLRAALRTGRVRSFVWAGVWAAAGMYGYFGGRTVLPALLLSGALSLWWPRVPRRNVMRGLSLMTATCLVLFAPQLWTILHHWERFQHRSRAVYILAGDNEHRSASGKAAILANSFGQKASALLAK